MTYLKLFQNEIFHFDIDVMLNARQRPTLIPATQTAGLRATAAFTTGLALPNGYT